MLFGKRKAALSLVAVGIFALTSCTFSASDNPIRSAVRAVRDAISPQEKETREKIEEIMEQIANEDKDALFEAFSEERRSKYGNELKSEIEELYDFLEGKIVSYGAPTHCGYTTMGTSYGTVNEYGSSPEVYDVVTEGGQCLVFRFSHVLVDDKASERLGLYSVCVCTQKIGDDGDSEIGELQVLMIGSGGNDS